MRPAFRALGPADAEAFQALRLAGLQVEPLAFASSYEDERDKSLAEIAARLDQGPDDRLFGAYMGTQLVGLAGLQREVPSKLRHKAWLWGMYVAPQARQQGVARGLVQAVLEHAATRPGLRHVLLGVAVDNAPACALYESFGFQIYGREPGFMQHEGALHDEYTMLLVLPTGDA